MSVGDWVLVGIVMVVVSVAFSAACVFALMGEEIAEKRRRKRAEAEGTERTVQP